MPPREPLIVQLPSVIGMVLAQVQHERATRDMKASGRQKLYEHLAKLTKALVPDVELTNQSTKGQMVMIAKVHGETLFRVSTRAEKLVFAAGDTFHHPCVLSPFRVDRKVEEHVRGLVHKRLPRIRDHYALNQGLPDHVRAMRFEDEGIQLTVEKLSDAGFKRVVEALRPLINLDRFNREDPI